MREAVDWGSSLTEPKYVLTQFTVEEFESFWPQFEVMLDTVPHTWHRWTKDSIYAGIATNHIQIWGMGTPGAATYIFLTQILTMPAMRILSMLWSAGEFHPDMMSLLNATMLDYARLNACSEIEVRGRPGFDRVLRDVGFERTAYVWTQRVSNHTIN